MLSLPLHANINNKKITHSVFVIPLKIFIIFDMLSFEILNINKIPLLNGGRVTYGVLGASPTAQRGEFTTIANNPYIILKTFL